MQALGLKAWYNPTLFQSIKKHYVRRPEKA